MGTPSSPDSYPSNHGSFDLAPWYHYHMGNTLLKSSSPSRCSVACTVGWERTSNSSIFGAEMDFAMYPNIGNLGVNIAKDSAHRFKWLCCMMKSLWQSSCCLFPGDTRTWQNENISVPIRKAPQITSQPSCPHLFSPL